MRNSFVTFFRNKVRLMATIYLSFICLSFISLSGCGAIDNYINEALEKQRVPFPIQENVCDFFDKTDYMREYWIGTPDIFDVPDVKVRIPSEYMDWRLEASKKVGRWDGAIGFGIRPLDFAPSQSYISVKEYPNGPIDPARPKYKVANGGLLLKRPGFISIDTRMFSLGTSSIETAENFPEDEFIAQSLASEEAEGLLYYPLGRSYLGKERLYYAENDRILIEFSCSPRERELSGEHYNASCSMYVNLGPVLAKLRFDRDFLPEWRSLLAKTEEFVECMIVEVEGEE